MRRAVETFVVGVAVVVAASCSGGSSARSGTPVPRWITTLCSSVSTWSTSVSDSAARFSAEIDSAATSVERSKLSLTATLDEVLRATDTMIAQLDANGPPAVDHGTKIQAKVVAAFRASRSVFADARARTQNLPSDTPGFLQQATAITTSIDDGFNAVGTAFGAVQKLDSDHVIAKAGDKAAACTSITRG